jgi:hypothetical protein
MKLKSELYLQELNLIMYGLTMQLKRCHDELMKEKRNTEIAAFFTPWARRQIWSAFSVNSDICMEYVKSLSELRDKILEAEGFDDDMKSITYAEIIAKTEDVNA